MTDTLPPSALLAPLYSSAAMRDAMDERARLQRMLDFEAALARAEGAVGVIPVGAVNDIAAACRAEDYDVAELRRGTLETGHIADALIAALTANVARRNPQSAGFVHWGASAQDLLDTALVLELRAAIDVLLADLDRATKALTALAGRHRRTMTALRFAPRQGLPLPFGLKAASYAAALARSRERLRRIRRETLALQFGDGAGTLGALGEHGLDVSERLAALLDLPHPDAPWHDHRDRLGEVASTFAVLAGSCGNIARDIAGLLQADVAEVSDVQNRDSTASGSSAYGPIAAAAALSAALQAPQLAATLLAAQLQDHDQMPGGWQIEWMTFPTLALVTSGALQAVTDIAEGLEIDVERMKQNLETGDGLIFAEGAVIALAPQLGRAAAQALVEELVRKVRAERRTLRQVLAADERVGRVLDEPALERLFRPTNYQGSAQTFIDRLVASSQGRQLRRPTELRSRMAELRSAVLGTKSSVAPADATGHTTPEADGSATAVVPPVHAELPAPQATATASVATNGSATAEPDATPLQPVAVAESPQPATPSAASPAAAVAPPAAPPPPNEPGALIEVFARVAAAAEEMASAASSERSRKPTS